MKQLFWAIALVVLIPITTTAQTGEITGKVRDAFTTETLPQANLQLYVLSDTVPEYYSGTTTDINGLYTFSNLPPADYILRTSYMGYTSDSVIHRIEGDEFEVYNPELVEGIMSGPVVIRGDADAIDLDGKGEGGGRTRMTRTELKRIPTRSAIVAITSKAAKIYDAKGDGTQLNFGGSRSNANAVYVDGVRVTGDPNIPMGAVSSVMVYTGGIPAKYGDFTGGVIEITTRSFDYFISGN
jgi:hypothetical protein